MVEPQIVVEPPTPSVAAPEANVPDVIKDILKEYPDMQDEVANDIENSD